MKDGRLFYLYWPQDPTHKRKGTINILISNQGNPKTREGQGWGAFPSRELHQEQQRDFLAQPKTFMRTSGTTSWWIVLLNCVEKMMRKSQNWERQEKPNVALYLGPRDSGPHLIAPWQSYNGLQMIMDVAILWCWQSKGCGYKPWGLESNKSASWTRAQRVCTASVMRNNRRSLVWCSTTKTSGNNPIVHFRHVPNMSPQPAGFTINRRCTWTVWITICLNRFVLIAVCSVEFLVVCLRICTGF